MSQGRKELRRVQLRLETTPGTNAAPRYLWRGMAEMPEDQREVMNVEELIGIFGGSDLSYIPKFQGALTFPESEAFFETLPVLFAAGGFGSLQGSAQGVSGSTVVHTYPIPAQSIPPTQSFTIEAGEPAQGLGGEAEVGTYCLVNELTLTFAQGEAMKTESQWVARTWERTNAAGSFSVVGTLVTPVEAILSGRGSAWITPAVSGASFGNGAVAAGNILGGQVTFSEMWALKFPTDSGQLYFHTAVYRGMTIEGEITFEHQATGTQSAAGTAGQKQRWRDQEPQLLRMQWTGGSIPQGTTFTRKTLILDLPIKYTTFQALDDQDGNSIITAEFMSKYTEAVPAAGRGTVTIVRQGTVEYLNG